MKFPAFEPINLKEEKPAVQTVELLLSCIVPCNDQPRKTFDEETLEKLSQSIKKRGLIQPIIVRKIPNSNKYEIIAGERRWRASMLAGLETIIAIVRDSDESDRMAVALIENIQRENLSPLEEAQAIHDFIEVNDMTHQQAADSLGKSRTVVTNLLRLLCLMDDVKTMLNTGDIEMGHAKALLRLYGEKQSEVAKIIIDKRLSVRETEKVINHLLTDHKSKKLFVSDGIKKRADLLSMTLSKNISQYPMLTGNVIVGPKGQGKVVIQFDSMDEIEQLIGNLSVTK